MSRVKPILFNTEMVRAILDGKTVTRRVIKFPTNRYTGQVPIADKVSLTELRIDKANFSEEPFYGFDVKLPYQPCDILYVRETWSDHYVPDEDGKPKLEYCYKADEINIKAECLLGENNRWYPSIHMPKEAARIWLKVTDVQVERLQDITEQQAKQEGFVDDTEYCVGDTARGHFAKDWRKTIKKKDIERYGWEANPWVWAIEFERCEKPESEE